MAQTPTCRQALALGLDVSGSVDALEYRLQLDGLALALDAPAVRNALLSMPSRPVEILVFEWSGGADQHTLIDWTAIRSQQDISEVQSLLANAERRPANPATSLGQAMLTGLAHLEKKSDCWSRTLDISGDGKNNIGPEPDTVRKQFIKANITLNALVIGADAPGLGDQRQEEIGELASYFQSKVIAGPDAFVQTAIGYQGYQAAMAAKLERELKGLIVSELLP